MKKVTLFAISFLVLSLPLFSQSYEADSLEVSEIINDIFDGMREGDTSKMAPYMHLSAKMQTLAVNEKGNKVSDLSGPESWLNAVANNNTDKVWNEEVDNLRINSDGAVATAWLDYKFYLDKDLSHCGVNSFQFIKVNEKWKIIYIIDSRFRDNCEDH